ncbi:hypothetical protein G3T14_07445 [Methylobacterium sp. BTF04]|uniref:hypothetical protein n=1 Tax=Methylobacterium sp. BTF04 TaxID=2708300 RepID=UPI0013D0DBB9|nr:hypothetical protein [Methylobacterium sp. BTF04]NEU11963.1 hypothetical protein [Methylobacterium sp. BTF04]
MRPFVLTFACIAVGLGSCLGSMAAEPASGGDLTILERDWKGCVRDAFTHQPAGQSKAGGQRNALDECKAQEDAYVTAVMAAQAAEDEQSRLGGRTMTARAREWAASVAAYVVDPVSSWLGMLKR